MEIEEKIMEKAKELCRIVREDRRMYGNGFVELGDRSIRIPKPQDIKVVFNPNGVVKRYEEN